MNGRIAPVVLWCLVVVLLVVVVLYVEIIIS